MPELIPAAPGSPGKGHLVIFYREPFTREVWPFDLAPGSNITIYPTAGYVVDHFAIEIGPEVSGA